MGCDQSRARDADESRERTVDVAGTTQRSSRSAPLNAAAPRSNRELVPTASYNDRRMQQENTLFDQLLERTTSNLINASEDVAHLAASEAEGRSRAYQAALQTVHVDAVSVQLPRAQVATSPIVIMERPSPFTPADLMKLDASLAAVTRAYTSISVTFSAPLVSQLPSD